MSDDFTYTTDFPELILHDDFGDPEQLLNMRTWLQKAIEAKGGKITGSGYGMGEADLDMELEGFDYSINIKPILKGDAS